VGQKTNTPFALVFFYQNEEHWLRLHLPTLMRVSEFMSVDLVGLDGGSEDFSSSIIREFGGKTFSRPFDNFGEQAEALLRLCESLGYNFILRLDPDELMFPEQMTQVFSFLMQGAGAISMSRFNFEEDRWHYRPDVFPDMQVRGIDTRCCKYVGAVHESVLCKTEIVMAPDISIFHYEGLNTPEHKMLKHINYKRMVKHLPRFEKLPEEYVGISMRHRERIEFSGRQPAYFNSRAPFGE
jgi:hypothetical protein